MENIELRDDEGRVRIRIGELANEVFGIGLFDRRGSEAAGLVLDPSGACLAFMVEGNVVTQYGAYGFAGDAAFPGPYLVFCDPDGARLFDLANDPPPSGRRSPLWRRAERRRGER